MHEAASGNAHTQKAAEKAALERGVVLERVDDGADFVLRFRGGNAADAVQVAREKFRPEAADEKGDGFCFRMQGVPKNALLEIFLRVIEQGAKRGFEVAR